MGVTVYREQEKSFAVGDRVQLTAPNNDLKIANREIGTIQNFDAHDGLRLRLESGREAVIDPQKFPHLDHGYAVTSYSGQGQTADRVLVHVDTELARTGLLNSRMAYVAISRGQWDAQIFTNDRSALANVLARDVSHQSAIQPQINVAAPAQEIAQAVRADVSQGLGLGL
jgi:ATP-dependent exoDNAse (exonuclease V) alpha subunit